MLTMNYCQPAASVCFKADLKGHWTFLWLLSLFFFFFLSRLWPAVSMVMKTLRSLVHAASPPLAIVHPFSFLSASPSLLHLSQVCLTGPPPADFSPPGRLKQQPWRPAPYPATTCQHTSWWWWGMVASGRAPWQSSFSRKSLCQTTIPQ